MSFKLRGRRAFNVMFIFLEEVNEKLMFFFIKMFSLSLHMSVSHTSQHRNKSDHKSRYIDFLLKLPEYNDGNRIRLKIG